MALDPGAINMATDETRFAMAILDRAGQDLTTGWSAAHGVIAGSAGQVGGDLLANVFLGSYEPRAGNIAQVMEKLVQLPGLIAAAGHRGIDDYLAGDAISRVFFQDIDNV